jgi:hypothetical protein
MLPALVEGYREVYRADQVMDRDEEEVAAAVAADALKEYHKSQAVDATPAPVTSLAHTSLHTALSTTIVESPEWEARRVTVHRDYAMVEVWTHESDAAWLPAPYRRTIFYHETELGWLPTTPPEVFWQPLATLQAGRFTFIYGRRDSSAALEAARQVEAVDAELRTELGLPTTDETLTVRVAADLMLELDPVDMSVTHLGGTLYVPSPALLALPAHISEGDALLQLVEGLLTARALREALHDPTQFCSWQPLANGLFPSLLWARSSLPSMRRYHTERFLRNLTHGDLPGLARLGPDRTACTRSSNSMSQDFGLPTDDIATSLVDYALSTYGRDRLSALIDGMRRYDAWDALIPAVFGVSATEFEAGWQKWLRKQ